MDESLKKKYGKILMLFYLQRKRKSDRRRKNVLRLLEFKIRNQERLLVMFNDLIYMYIYNELNVHEPKRRIRSCRSYERNKGWGNIVNMSYSEERFKQTFRMSRRTFSFVLEKIRAAISKQDTDTGSIPAEERMRNLFASKSLPWQIIQKYVEFGIISCHLYMKTLMI